MNVFEKKELWQTYNQDRKADVRCKLLLDFIPAEVRSIVDIGCGNGLLTNLLPGKYAVTGVDNSQEALSYLRVPSVCADAQQLPFTDESFDLALSSQMLEHLDEQTLYKAIEEMKRVARKYLLISVPNAENILQNAVECANCGNIFNPYQHLQSFTLLRLQQLLAPRYALIRHETCGDDKPYYNNFLLSIKHRVAKSYYQPRNVTVCPYCGGEEFTSRKNFLSKTCNALNRIIARKRAYWMVSLWEK